MFGVANQLFVTLALTIGTTYLINNGKVKYIWITVIPMLFVGTTTITGGIKNQINIFNPQMMAVTTRVQGSINTILTLVILVCVMVIITEAGMKWAKLNKS